MRTLWCCLSANVFKAACKLVNLSLMGFPPVFSCQDDCSVFYACAVLGKHLAQQNTSWETPVIIASIFPKVLENAHCTPLNPKIWLSVCMIARASSSLWMSMRHFWMVESHSLVLVSWHKAISLSNFLRNVTFGVISTTEWLHSEPEITGDEKEFWTPQFSQGWVFGLTCRSKLLLFLSTVLLPFVISQLYPQNTKILELTENMISTF